MTHYSLFRQRKGSIGTSELIFRILAETYPLSIAKLHTALFRHDRVKLSFQAVSKCVAQMRSEGVLEKTSAGYQLSLDWLLFARSKIDTALTRYRSVQATALDKHAAFQTFTASSLYEADTLWGDILFQLCRSIPKAERKRVVSLNHYCWWLPLNLGRERELFDRIRALGFEVCFLFSNASQVNRDAAALYRRMQVRARVGVSLPIEPTTYYNLINDQVIRVEIPERLHAQVAALFSSASSLEALDLEQASALGAKRAEIKLSIFKSALIRGVLPRELKNEDAS